MKTIKVPKGKSFRSFLVRSGACWEARSWVGKKSLRTAWRTCERADWMLHLADEAEIDRKTLVTLACYVAKSVLKYVPANNNRPRLALDMAESWCRGELSAIEVSKATRLLIETFEKECVKPTQQELEASYAAFEAAESVYSINAAAYVSDVIHGAAYASNRRGVVRGGGKLYADMIRSRIPVELIASGLEGK